MKLGIMQPYFFPYIGYFSLIKIVDKYVIYDDVNYIKSGWINRNNILLNEQAYSLNINLQGASSSKKINEITIIPDKTKMLKTITQAYRKAPYYSIVYPLLENLLNNYTNPNLACFLYNTISEVCNYIGLTTELIISSSIEKDNTLKGENKVISICKIFDTTDYYNAIGGLELYSYDNFKAENILLHFVKMQEVEYKQYSNKFVENLSIIDVMMFNSPEEINKMLDNYSLI